MTDIKQIENFIRTSELAIARLEANQIQKEKELLELLDECKSHNINPDNIEGEIKLLEGEIKVLESKLSELMTLFDRQLSEYESK